MTILQVLGDRTASAESRYAAAEFTKLARLIAATKGDKAEALAQAQQYRVKPRVCDILKSVVTPGNLADWGSIADYRVISSAFSVSLRSLSAFDGMLPDFVPAPLRSRGIVITTGITGASVHERMLKPISSIALGSALVEPRKSTAIVVATEEVFKSGDANTAALFDNELRKGVVAATDTVFISALIAATTPTPSAGATYANAVSDFRTLFAAVSTRANSKLFYIVSPANVKNLMFVTSNQGTPILSLLRSAGETLPVTVVASDQVGNAALLVDATGIAGSADIISLDSSSQTSLQLDTSPDSPPSASTNMLSLFQSDHRALRAERFFGFTVLRSSAVASLSGVAY